MCPKMLHTDGTMKIKGRESYKKNTFYQSLI